LSKLNPADALKKEIKIGGKNFSLRKTLVVVQFSISIIMISATIIIYQQLNYLQQKDLGVEVDNLLVMDINSGELRNQYDSIKQEFEKLSQVQHVTVSSRVPGEWKEFPVAEVEDVESDNKARMIFVGADKDFLDTYNIRLIEGRNLRNDLADSASVLISKSGVQDLGLTNPVGRTVDITGTVWAGDFDEQDRPFTPRIVGIVEDFHFQSLREQRKPVMLASYRNPIHNIDYYTLKIQTDNWQETIAELQAINNRFDPENPMEYTFLDTRFDEFYEADQTRGQLLLLFSGVIIFIACMGLFALASFAIENRIKEIGVRKVLGATIMDIVWMLTSNFAMLVGIGFLISVPITYWVIQNWLQEFAYRISIPWWAFIAAGGVALIIAIGTVSWQTIRAALLNPVESLRSE
jgi:putative ABC transport system permease protein